jgi:hypothetical protein
VLSRSLLRDARRHAIYIVRHAMRGALYRSEKSLSRDTARSTIYILYPARGVRPF